MGGIRSVCVYCGSRKGASPDFAAAAAALGTALAQEGLTLVYGGGSVGLMGVLADAAIAAGGRVVGVIPRILMERELAHRGLAELVVTESMQERKAKMAELSDAFIALPGGIGTLDELFEMWTWAQLGLHEKPCAMVNTAGYYDPLVAFLDGAVRAGFLRPEVRSKLRVFVEPGAVSEFFT
ncbi:MAG: Cytokinin riboside 5'-monophosphate phosphoribohydrolase [Steroidobacteraceae bacterium]|nr:Cytokinin riboside 5'-monophosphate phosphoribohydrolase [Steroidobacteraceae bacterium]